MADEKNIPDEELENEELEADEIIELIDDDNNIIKFRLLDVT